MAQIIGEGLETSLMLNTLSPMPLVGLGTWKSKPGEVAAAVEAALRAGYRHIDCAAVYGNEAEIGEVFASLFGSGEIKREEVFIVSKLWNTDHDPEHVLGALEKTLKDLQLEYLDLYLIHWPLPFAYDNGNLFPKDEEGNFKYSDVPNTATWGAMEQLVDAGLTRSIGLSNFNHKQIQEILDMARIPPAVLQVECHPYFNQQQLWEFCSENGIACTAYAPLGSSDRPFAKPDDPVLLTDKTINEIAQRYNVTPAQILIRFHIERGWTVIPKSTKVERIKENGDVFNFQLSKEDLRSLLAIQKGFRFCGPAFQSATDQPTYPFHEAY